jgi:putative DNA primase/helicase
MISNGKQLLPHHRDEFHKSGLSDETIAAAGVYSETNADALASVLNWNRVPKKLGPCIVIPFTGADGSNGYCRAKPDRPRICKADGKPIKYESPRGQPNRIYLPPGVAAVADKPEVEIIITEGEKKALAVSQHVGHAIGLVGVYGWKAKRSERLLPEIERFNWRGRQVRIVFDSDMADKAEIQDAIARLAKLLQNLGAVVKVVQLPHGPPDASGKPTKMGADDFLVAHGAGELRKLLNSAADPEPPDAETTKKLAIELDPAPEAKAILAPDVTDGVSRLRFYAGSFHRHADGKYTEVPTAEVRGKLVCNLNERYCRLSAGIVGNLMDQLRAQTLLPASIEAPAWLVGNQAWPPHEVLSTPTGLVHLPSFIDGGREYLIPPTPKFFTFSALDYPFEENPAHPATWEWFLNSLFDGDAESIALLQQWFGLALLPETRFQKILFIVGPKRSGKGTIARVLTRLVGAGNVCNPTLGSLADRFGLWPLIGKLLAIVSDARLSGRSDQAPIVERLLSVSGEDNQTIDRKNLPPWNGKLPTRFVICTNEVPRLNDTSGALASRMLVLQLRQSFFGNEMLDLTEKLRGEVSGILRWAIDGWRVLTEQGRFTQPASSLAIAEELADLGSPVGVFVREKCRLAPEFSIPRAELYKAFKEWAEANGRQHIEDEAGFGRSLRAAVPGLGTTQPRIFGQPVRHYAGIEIDPSATG